ncbi:CoA-binding protein [uncultured Desulfobacter sp.]|uniref:CoA-binding protein n=1 Tax=uncultured Desulfobacter sp. TaxID=240139 RepID=UPI0029F50F95|nr:CoA-binding protein [uncultured Desulfobacter sp.]
MEEKKETVAVVGASPLKDRYSNKAQTMLEEYGHLPVPVAPKHETIEGKTVYHALSDIPQTIDTVTMYLGPTRQDKVIEQILNIKPKRVIFNPGTENPQAYERLKSAEIKVQEACTLVLLKTDQYMKPFNP